MRLGWAALALLLLGAEAAQAAESPALYQATAIVTGTDTRQRPLGFANCLREVVVKLTGAPRLHDDPAVLALAATAETLVASYAYVDPRAGLLHHDDQGTYDRSYELTVRFDPARIEAALATIGTPVWHGPRPLLSPVILVRSREPEPYLLSAETPRGAALRAELVRIAAEHGMGVRFPTEGDLAAWGIGLYGFPTPLAAPDASVLQVTGTLSWNIQALGWIGTWRARQGEAEHDWDIRGVAYDRAFTDLVRGAVMLAAGTGVP